MKSTVKNCPVSDPNVGIISEQSHYTNQCICFMCTCGRHICPSWKSQFFPRSHYRSLYKQDFVGHSVQMQAPKKVEEYKPSKGKFESATTHKSDFKGEKPTDSNKRIRPSSSGGQIRFIGSSQYQANYINWGSNYVSYHKRPVHPQHHGAFRLSDKTTYSDSFCPREQTAPSKKARKKERRFTQAITPYLSTTQSDFKKVNSQVFLKEKIKKESYKPVKYAPSHFVSEFSKSFKNLQNTTLEPHVLRKQGFKAL